MDLKHLASCSDLIEEHFAEYTKNRELTYALLDRCAEICQPHCGAQKILLFLARLALANSWVDGEVRVDVRFTGVMFKCHLVLSHGIGGGGFETLKKIELNASFREFKDLAKDPKNILPFKMEEYEVMRRGVKEMWLTFTAPLALRRSSLPPPEYATAQQRMRKQMAIPKPAGLPIIALVEPAAPSATPEVRKPLVVPFQPRPELQAMLDAHRVKATPPKEQAQAKQAAPASLGSEARKRTLAYDFSEHCMARPAEPRTAPAPEAKPAPKQPAPQPAKPQAPAKPLPPVRAPAPKPPARSAAESPQPQAPAPVPQKHPPRPERINRQIYASIFDSRGKPDQLPPPSSKSVPHPSDEMDEGWGERPETKKK